MEEKKVVRRKSYTAMFKLEVVNFVKEKRNREEISRWILESYGDLRKKITKSQLQKMNSVMYQNRL
jgi:hypothetical protein